MTTMKDLIRDFGKEIIESMDGHGDPMPEDEFEDLLNDLMEELKKFFD